MAGLCGNFDLKTINEMRTPENLELTNPQEFGSSWAAVEVKLHPDGPWPELRKPGKRDIGVRQLLQLLSQPLSQQPQPQTVLGLKDMHHPVSQIRLHTCPRLGFRGRVGTGKETKSLF